MNATVSGSSAPIQCPVCHAANRGSATFCDECGRRLISHPIAPAPAASPDASPPGRTPPAIGSAIPTGVGWHPARTAGGPPEASIAELSAAHVAVEPRHGIRAALPPERTGRSFGQVLLALVLTVAFLALAVVLFLFLDDMSSGRMTDEEGQWALGVLILEVVVFAGMYRAWRARRHYGDIVGEAHDVRERMETDASMQAWMVWSFRIERYDRSGNRLPPIAVELRGMGFTGTVSEGDWVEVRGPVREGRTLNVSEVYNETTRAVVRAKGRPLMTKVSYAIGWGILLLIVAGILYVVIASTR